MYSLRFSLLILGLFVTNFLDISVAQEAKSDVVVAEGVGKDEASARKAAFRDAVSKVVGTLVEAETLIKNDRIIEDRILEFSGGFIKTFDVIKVEKVEGDLVRVRIKATVERLQVLARLSDAKIISSTTVKGSDLVAEKLTKEEARKNAGELLSKLFAELPNLMKAEAVGKPVLSADQKSVRI